jgi:hypothetical protein
MSVLGSGNVGIGTTTPTHLLHLNGTTLALNTENGASMGGFGQLSITHPTPPSATGVVPGFLKIGYDSATGGWGTCFLQGVVPNLQQAPIVLNPIGGNVGIGTTTPSFPLHVSASNANNTTTLTVSNTANANTGFGAQIFFDNFGGAAPLGSIAALRSNNVENYSAHMAFSVNLANAGSLTERMRIAANGNVGIGTTAPIAPLDVRGTTVGDLATFTLNSSRVMSIYGPSNASNGGWASAASILYLARDTATNRSVNASGTFNASGADYAEYMTKDSDFPAQKGDLLGVLPSGKLTNQFDDAIHFLLKSTNPCMVGGDVWGSEAIVGEKPKEPENATEEEKAAHAVALAAWEARLEAERQKVDRMAFAGQVPVNILGATPGNYIIPLRNADGSIGIAAVAQADMTFSQYQSAVGRVISILEDGRANVIVKAV